MTQPLAVFDASVAVKLVLEEELSAEAYNLYVERQSEHSRVYGPAIMPNEVANAIYQRLRRGTLTIEQANTAVDRFFSLPFTILTKRDLSQQAYEFALWHGLSTIYGAIYVVLARDLGAELWTDNRRLLNIVSDQAPWVRWLGSY